MKNWILYIFICLFQLVFAQTESKEDTKKDRGKDYLFTKEMYGGARLQTNGITLYIERGWIKTIYNTHILQVEYQYFLDPHEKLSKSLLTEGGRSYVFGLQNRFHAIRAAYGFERMIADKADKKGVKLSVVGFLGGTLGLLKPYNLSIQDSTDGFQDFTHNESYTGKNQATFLNRNKIEEAAPFYVGMNKMRITGGAHAKVGLNFDWGVRDAFVRAIEAGVSVDVFYQKVPILVNSNNNKMVFVAFYVGFHLGKRW